VHHEGSRRIFPMARVPEFSEPNFHEKALFVKADLAAHFGIERNGCVSFALCFHPHF
jgi:hypothetical protein